MNTKDKIMESSLALFARKGFAGVSVREIAREVGVRESALYKHFKNKQDILDCIMTDMKERISKAYVDNQVPEAVSEDIAKGYQEMSQEDLCEMSWRLFQVFTKDPVVSEYRKLLMREQFVNIEAAKLYSSLFLQGVIAKQKNTFESLVLGGIFREEEPEIIALHFYAPILLLFQQYDCQPEQEAQIKDLLFRHVRAFGRNYGSNHEMRDFKDA